MKNEKGPIPVGEPANRKPGETIEQQIEREMKERADRLADPNFKIEKEWD